MTDVETLFRYGHLPAHLQAASKPFYDLATSLAVILAPSDERTLAIQKLWEAKNLAVFAVSIAYEPLRKGNE